MIILAFLILMGINAATSRIHSLKYFHTASSQVPNVPEFVSVGLVDDVQIVHYESKKRRALPKQDWMNLTTDPRYWQRETTTALQHQQDYKGMINLIKQIFNHDGGGHVLQVMSGCEWNNETGEIRGYEQYGYDGEDFVRYDLETETWIAQVPQADIIKQKWDANAAGVEQKKYYLTKHYPDLLKEFLYYVRSSLLRTVLPSVSLLQKSPSSPISCHATGFYPNSSILFWRKDGKELHEGVDQGEILPNHDGTFQRRRDLQVPSVPPEAWGMYECVFQLAGVEDEIITKLNKAVILTNREKDDSWIVIYVVPVAILTFILLIVTGRVFCRKRKASDASEVSEVSEKLMKTTPACGERGVSPR